MSAPKLLDKKTVHAEVATQKLQQIKEGITLAKKVDKVRDTLGEEEARLEKFRTESIAKIQQEIDAKIRERDTLESGNKKLREERAILETPVDLTLARLEIANGKEELGQWRAQLAKEQIEVDCQRDSNNALAENLDRRERNIERRDILSERTLIEAEAKFEQAAQEFTRAKAQSQKIIGEAKEREKNVMIREQEIDTQQVALDLREASNQAHETDLSNRERKLRMNEQIFIRAQKYIKSKKKK